MKLPRFEFACRKISNFFAVESGKQNAQKKKKKGGTMPVTLAEQESFLASGRQITKSEQNIRRSIGAVLSITGLLLCLYGDREGWASAGRIWFLFGFVFFYF